MRQRFDLEPDSPEGSDHREYEGDDSATEGGGVDRYFSGQSDEIDHKGPSFWFKALSLLLVVALVVVYFLFPLGGLVSADDVAIYGIAGVRDYKAAMDVLSLMNKARAEEGLPLLSLDSGLTEAAMQRATECCLRFSHTRPNGLLSNTALPAGSTRVGENIAAGQRTPDEVMTSWMNSEGHRKNILQRGFITVGIGCFYKNGILYWAQEFGDGPSLDLGQNIGGGSAASEETSASVVTPVEVRKDLFTPVLVNLGEMGALSASHDKAISPATLFIVALDPTGLTADEAFSGMVPTDPSFFTFSVADTEVATVGPGGVVRGVSPGSTRLTATLKTNGAVSVSHDVVVDDKGMISTTPIME